MNLGRGQQGEERLFIEGFRLRVLSEAEALGGREEASEMFPRRRDARRRCPEERLRLTASET